MPAMSTSWNPLAVAQVLPVTLAAALTFATSCSNTQGQSVPHEGCHVEPAFQHAMSVYSALCQWHTPLLTTLKWHAGMHTVDFKCA